jgi:hypothetical protein
VIVTASYLESDDSAFKFGTGSRHPITRVKFTDSIIANSRIGIALFMKDGGEFSDFTASNIDIATASRHATDHAVYLDIDRRSRESALGRIRDVTLRDLRVRTRGNLLIGGHPAAPIERLRIEGLDLRVTGPVDLATLAGKPRGNALLEALPDSVDYARTNAHLTVAHVRDLVLTDVRIAGTSPADSGARHAVWLRDVDDLRCRGLRTDGREGARAAVVVDGGGALRFEEVVTVPGPSPAFAVEVAPRLPIVVRDSAPHVRLP